jgi:hypothetical protein
VFDGCMRFCVADPRHRDLAMPLNPQQLERFACHMLAYAEVLQSWQLPKKRLELLKFIHQWLGPLMNQSLHPTAREHDIGLPSAFSHELLVFTRLVRLDSRLS